MCCYSCGKRYYGYQAVVCCTGPLCDRKIHRSCISKLSDETLKNMNISLITKNDEDPTFICKQCQFFSTNGTDDSNIKNIINKENKYKFIYETFKMVQELTKEVGQLRSDNEFMKNEISNLRTQLNKANAQVPSYAKRVQNVPEANKNKSESRTTLHSTPGTSQDVITNKIADKATSATAPTTNRTSTPVRIPLTQQSTDDTAPNHPLDEGKDDNDWIIYQNKRRRKGPPPLQGCRQMSGLNVTKKKKAFFASRFNPDTTDKDIEDYLKKEFKIEYVKCTKLVSKFDHYASFHVSVTCDDFAKLNHENAWPEGILAKPFYGNLRDGNIIANNDDKKRNLERQKIIEASGELTKK